MNYLSNAVLGVQCADGSLPVTRVGIYAGCAQAQAVKQEKCDDQIEHFLQNHARLK